MNIGDLVRFKKEHPHKILGIVVNTNWQKIDPCQLPAVKVMWSGKYGTFWTRTRELEVINESR